MSALARFLSKLGPMEKLGLGTGAGLGVAGAVAGDKEDGRLTLPGSMGNQSLSGAKMGSMVGALTGIPELVEGGLTGAPKAELAKFLLRNAIGGAAVGGGFGALTGAIGYNGRKSARESRE